MAQAVTEFLTPRHIDIQELHLEIFNVSAFLFDVEGGDVNPKEIDQNVESALLL